MELADLFALWGVPRPETEFPFAAHLGRRWRFDAAWPEYKVAFEKEGGVWKAGRHTRPSGFLKDVEKYNEAALLGWLLIRGTPDQLKKGQVVAWVLRALNVRGFEKGQGACGECGHYGCDGSCADYRPD